MKASIKNIAAVALVVPSLVLLNGCARNIEAGTYASGNVGEAMTSYEGVLVAKRQVDVENKDKLQDNQTGMLAGGVGGAVVGSQFGGGRGSALATVAGAALGALGGAYAEKAMTGQKGWEYTVRINDGGLKTVVQGLDVNLNVGQKVILHVGYKGRSRVVPMQQGVY